MASPSRRFSASVRLRSSASTSSTWSSDPEASPTRISATYIARKQPLVPRQRFGETLAGDDARADIGDHRPQPAEIAVGGEQFETVIDARAGAQQQREIAGENGDVFGLGLVEQAEGAARRAALLQRDVVDQHQAEPLDPLRDIARRRRGDRAGDQFAVAVQGAIAVVRHRITEWS